MSKRWAKVVAGGSVLIAGVFAAGSEGAASAVPEEVRAFLPGVRAVWPGMEELRRVRAGVCELRDREGRKIGSLLYETISDAERQFGYAGTIEVAILLDPEEKVAGVLIGKNRETPAFLNRVRARKFLESWNRLPVTAVPGREVDTVTGATLSSNAIRSGVRKLAAAYAVPVSREAVSTASAEEEIARLEKRIAVTRRILKSSNVLLKQLEERREDHLKLQLVAAVEGKQAAQVYAKQHNLYYFNHPGRSRASGPVEAAAAAYRASGSGADLEKLNRALEEEYERLLLSVPPHNAEHEKSLAAMERRLASLKAGSTTAPEEAPDSLNHQP